jgi:FMN reductase
VTTILGVSASPDSGGRTATGVAAVLRGAADARAETRLLELATTDTAEALAAIAAADAIVLASPVYRATISRQLKQLLEHLERGKWGEQTAPLRGKAAAIVMTGASWHHFLSLGDLRNILASFFAVQVLSPGLYLEPSQYAGRERLTDEAEAVARLHGAPLVALADVCAHAAVFTRLEPQA